MIELGSLNIKVEGKELRTDKKDEMYFLLATDMGIKFDVYVDNITRKEYMRVYDPPRQLVDKLEIYRMTKQAIDSLLQLC